MPNPHVFTNLGGKEKVDDTRDVYLGAAGAPVYTFPQKLTNQIAFAMPVEYQGGQPACGAHAGGALQGIKRTSRYSPRYTWKDIKTFDGIPIEDGTDMRSIFKSLTKTGVLDFPLLGNEVTLSHFDYAHAPVTDAMNTNAMQHKGDGYGFIADRTFSGIKQFIFDNGPSIMLMRVGNELWTAPNGQASWEEKDIMPMRVPSQIVSGHFVVLHSYDEQYIYYINSFGPTWGRAGHGYFGLNYMPFINDVGTLFPLAFKKDLQQGMTDPDIKHLQVVLNKDPRTRVATTGAGSPGLETNYFGALTFTAVKKFQTLYAITPVSGYCGPLTRAVLNGFV